ncbi:hypothetical protein Tco_1095942, partial [Tanacetum coccineum]
IAKFVRDFKSLAKEADESLAKHKVLEYEIEHLLRAIVSQDLMSIVQSNSVVDTSNLLTKLDRTKEKLENCIIKKEKEYAIKRLQAQLGDFKGKSQDTPCVSDTLDPLSQKLENENVELEFQVVNYIREIEHLKTIYKNLFDSISVTRTQTKTLTDSLQTQLHDSIHENAKLRAHLFDKVSKQKNTTKGMSVNTMFTKQSILGKPPSFSKPKLYFVTPFPKFKGIPKVGKSNALIKPVTSNSIPITKESKVVTNDKIAIRNAKSEVVCAMCKKCLITANHDVRVLNYVNGMNSRKRNQKANVSNTEYQKKQTSQVWKLKKVGSKERLASPKPSTPRSCLRWSLTGRIFDLKGKIIESSESDGQSDISEGDIACTSNPQEPIKWFPNSTFSMTGRQNWFDTLLIPLLSEYKPKEKEGHGDDECAF